jgi:predicted PurR-regulated permease PerM
MPHEERSQASQLEITLSWSTILKLLAALLLVFLAVQLWPLLELLFLALLIAIALFPLMHWTRRHRWPDWIGVLLSALLLFVGVALFAAILFPTIGNQGAAIIQKLPEFQKEVVGHLPQSSVFRDAVNKAFESASFSNPEPLLKQFLAWGSVVLKGLAEFLVVLVVAVYFVADGERVYKWLLAFLPEKHRKKAAAASPQIAEVVSSYMIGQLITSLLCGTYAFIILSLLHVPNAALLGIIAGVFDILPLIGFFLSILPAVIVALSVSTTTAVLVFVLYGAYHLVENYFIVPKVYGNRLRLSTLTVLVSCMAAALVAGVVGAIAILPIVASYPIIERIWLKRHLEPDTVAKHEQIDAEEHPPT